MQNPSKEDERNRLAELRTRMANERTLMAFYRTAFAVVGVAAFIFKFYEDTIYQLISILLLITGAILAAYGSFRYRRMNRRIKEPTVIENKNV